MRWLPVAVVAALPVTGCVYHDSTRDHANVAYAGDITFQWSFPGGSTCPQLPDVQFIHVTLDGPSRPEPLDQQGWYNCTVAGFDGITLKNFDPATYTFTIDAYDSSRTDRLYSATGTVTVNGNVTQRVTLNRFYATGHLNVYWRYLVGSQERSCADAGIADSMGVSKVSIRMNNEPAQVLDCTQADSNHDPVQGWSWDKIPGTYQVSIDAYIPRGTAPDTDQLWYSGTQTVTVVAGMTQSVTVTLLPVAGGATFFPILKNTQGHALSCHDSGIGVLNFKLTDELHNTTPTYSCSCGDCASGGLKLDYLRADQHYDSTSGYWATWKVEIWGDDGTLFSGSGNASVRAGLKAYDSRTASSGQGFDIDVPEF